MKTIEWLTRWLAAIVILLATSCVAPTTQSSGEAATDSSNDCVLVSGDLGLSPELRDSYAKIPPATTWKFGEPNKGFESKYVPPHRSGDKDFWGNGPDIEANVSIVISSEGIKALVSMTAKETKPDYTFADGSEELWFFQLKENWRLQRTGVISYTSGQETGFLLPAEGIVDIDQDSEKVWVLKPIHYVDTDFTVDGFPAEVDKFPPDQPDTEIMRSIEIVGDTEGDEAGTKTGITIYMKFTGFELCPN